MMDILRAVYEARPGVKWVNNQVNPHNIDTIKAAYIGADFPTAAELEAAWIDCLKEEKRSQTKNEANRRIIDMLPEWKQRNYTAKSVELTEKKVDGLTLNQEELNFLAAIKDIWASVQQIRTASDTIEAEINNIGISADLETYNIEVNQLWP